MKVSTDQLTTKMCDHLSRLGYMIEIEDGCEFASVTKPALEAQPVVESWGSMGEPL